MVVGNVEKNQYSNEVTGLQSEFEQQFGIFYQLKTDLIVFSSPFKADISDLPVNIQLDVVDLKCVI